MYLAKFFTITSYHAQHAIEYTSQYKECSEFQENESSFVSESIKGMKEWVSKQP